MEAFDFGLNIKRLREANDYTQREVASFVGVSESAISKIENNYQPPTPGQLIAFSRIFRTDANTLLGLSNRNPIYIDDLPQSKQQMILDIIDIVRKEHTSSTGD